MLTGLAQAASSGSGGGYGGALFWVIVIGILAVMWMMTGRTRKQQRLQVDMRNNLAPGDEVMTGAGLYGTVVSADGDVIVLETSPGVQQRWARGAIVRKVDPDVPSEEVVEEDEPELDEPEGDEFEVPDDASSLDPDGPDDKKP